MKSASALKEHRHNGLIDLPSTRLILLDTLDQTPGPGGRLGAEQIAWALSKIDETPTKQVIVVGHHNPQVGGDPSHFKSGIADTADFWPEIAKRPQVKAYIHGHTHEWTQALDAGIHILSTIACAYVFNANTNHRLDLRPLQRPRLPTEAQHPRDRPRLERRKQVVLWTPAGAQEDRRA
ncbi:MAG: hypothetical protein EBQ59_02300 [Verrucomicrobia bacterium]|nr:hypothetical protein [Verrucomicrobiota bacterium]